MNTEESKWTLTSDEWALLSLVNPNARYNYLCRDEKGTLWLYKNKPQKGLHSWYTNSTSWKDFLLLPASIMYRSVRWEDNEPCNIFTEITLVVTE